MKKIIVLFAIFLLMQQTGYCTLMNQEINVFNLKENNMYILNVDSSVKNINISDKNVVNLTPVTSISNDKKQIFIEANKSGVCDVVLTTDSDAYQIRFVSGPVFQDNISELIQIDVPLGISAE